MLPYYGDVGLMQTTVRSVLAQDDQDWRLTVVDDGYPDDSIPGWFASLGDDRITYLRNEENLGANRNFQKCIGLIKHELVVVMGADDVMLPNYVRTVRAAHEAQPNASVIQPGVELIDENGEPAKTLVDEAKRRLYSPKGHGRQIFCGEDLAVSLLRGNWLYFPSLAWRADAITTVGFREGLNVVQDLALVMDLVQRGDQLVVDDTVCFQYRRHRASDSSWRAMAGTRFIEERNYFLDVAGRLQRQGWTRAAKVARTHVSSRLHALSLLPKAVKNRHREGMRNLSRHAFGPSRPV
ncbi:putative glycosyltransferase [Actinoalloteichus sp. GBA129-24]|uniref:Glycosyltransferase n=2 Tax=Pseudonocardiaceae TaxID=2070 RepID=A0AAC9PPU5_9PSEU|nr:putative glycosyltransferase [Actinoalloteichus fjordicus]APU18184.1 putative glycosyltransferase [Actinoalloteichus sp. GBA129-24]